TTIEQSAQGRSSLRDEPSFAAAFASRWPATRAPRIARRSGGRALSRSRRAARAVSEFRRCSDSRALELLRPMGMGTKHLTIALALALLPSGARAQDGGTPPDGGVPWMASCPPDHVGCHTADVDFHHED